MVGIFKDLFPSLTKAVKDIWGFGSKQMIRISVTEREAAHIVFILCGYINLEL